MKAHIKWLLGELEKAARKTAKPLRNHKDCLLEVARQNGIALVKSREVGKACVGVCRDGGKKIFLPEQFSARESMLVFDALVQAMHFLAVLEVGCKLTYAEGARAEHLALP